jgi:pimeloyl-ACP methyl ester carboxylesterase
MTRTEYLEFYVMTNSAAIEAPTLVVAGEDDPCVPLRNGRLHAGRIPDARLHVVPGGGHLFLLDEPENVAGAIRAFLDED